MKQLKNRTAPRCLWLQFAIDPPAWQQAPARRCASRDCSLGCRYCEAPASCRRVATRAGRSGCRCCRRCKLLVWRTMTLALEQKTERAENKRKRRSKSATRGGRAPPQVQVAQRRRHLELSVHVFAEQGVVGPLDRGEHRLHSSVVNVQRQMQQGRRMRHAKVQGAQTSFPRSLMSCGSIT
jgi:hypothetical protein